MDFSAFSIEHLSSAKPMTVLNPLTGDPTDTTIDLISYNSDAGQDVLSAQRDAKLLSADIVDGKVVFSKQDPADSRRELVDLLVAVTTGWTNMVYDGRALDPTPENFRFIYERVPSIRRQADTFAGDSAQYFKN